MSTQGFELDYSAESRFFFSQGCGAPIPDGATEAESNSEPTYTHDNFLFSGMTRAPENISDVIVKKLREIAGVRAVLMGRSGDVYHVWTMLDEWSAPARRSVYAAQRELLLKLKGFDLDFYVVAAEDGEDPCELVSDIPIVWERAA